MKQSYLKQMLSRDKSYRSAFVLAVAVPFVCAAAAALVLWGRTRFRFFFLPCNFKRLTGLNCLSCGATRATFALLNGDFVTAVYYNPLYIAFLGCLAYGYIRLILSLAVRPYRSYVVRLDWKRAAVITVILVAFTIIRNFSFYQSIFY